MDHELWQILNEIRSGQQELGNGINFVLRVLEEVSPAKYKIAVEKIKKEAQQQQK